MTNGRLKFLKANATLSGKKLLAKIVNGVKQPTVFCPFERLVRHTFTQL
jgi:hypothetical protein